MFPCPPCQMSGTECCLTCKLALTNRVSSCQSTTVSSILMRLYMISTARFTDRRVEPPFLTDSSPANARPPTAPLPRPSPHPPSRGRRAPLSRPELSQAILEPSGAVLEASGCRWPPLGLSWALLGASCGPIRVPLGYRWTPLGSLLGRLGALRGRLGPPWARPADSPCAATPRGRSLARERGDGRGMDIRAGEQKT